MWPFNSEEEYEYKTEGSGNTTEEDIRCHSFVIEESIFKEILFILKFHFKFKKGMDFYGNNSDSTLFETSTFSTPTETDSTEINKKFCSACKFMKPPTDFHKSKTKEDDRQNQCKECHAQSRKNSYYRY